MTQPGYWALLDTVSAGSNVFTCVDDDTVPDGNPLGDTYDADVILPLNDPVLICVELDTNPAGNADWTCAEDDTVPVTVLNRNV